MIRSSLHTPSRRKREPRQRSLARCALIVTLVFVSQIIGLERAYSTDNSIPNLKLFAYHSFKTWDQFSCYNYLVIRESHWNYKASNGSHYGLGQMRNPKVKYLPPRTQIIWHMRYIGSRYGYVNKEPNACRAAEHLDKYGWH